MESEKAVATIPSSSAGTVEKIHVKPGQNVSAGTLLLTLAVAGGGDSVPAPTDAGTAAVSKSVAAPPAAADSGVAVEGNTSADVSGVALDVIPDNVPIPAASPSIRFIAAQLGLDLRRVTSVTGGDRVTTDNLKSYIDTIQKLAAKGSIPSAASGGVSTSASVESIDFSQWGEVLKKPMSQLRKVIARRMSENWNAIPHVTQFDNVDMSGILALRKKYLAVYADKGVKLTVTPFVLKAVVNVLKKHAIFNSSLDEATSEIILKEYFHLGLAVDTDAGLYVPVIRDVDKKDMVALSQEVADLAAKARDRKLTADDMKGGTFSISNQGAFGGGHFTPIVNRPEVAILGLGRSAEQAVVCDGEVSVRSMMPVALSYDHRVIDGGSAARFTVDLVRAFESFDENEVAL
jgi:pyruvate dehydrogenase E2 component (dihydrolipoamide acetyltransferase)